MKQNEIWDVNAGSCQQYNEDVGSDDHHDGEDGERSYGGAPLDFDARQGHKIAA